MSTYGTNVTTLPSSTASSATVNIRTDLSSENITLINKFNPYSSTPTGGIWGGLNGGISSGSETCYYYYTYYANTNMNATIYIYVDDSFSAYLNNNIIVENKMDSYYTDTYYTIQLVTGFNFFKFICINTQIKGFLAFLCLNNNSILFNTNSSSASDSRFKNLYMPISYNYLNTPIFRFSDSSDGIDGTIACIWSTNQNTTGTRINPPIGTIKYTYTYINSSYTNSNAAYILATLYISIDDYIVVILNREHICSLVGGNNNSIAIKLSIGYNYFEFYCTNAGSIAALSLKCVKTSNNNLLFSKDSDSE